MLPMNKKNQNKISERKNRWNQFYGGDSPLPFLYAIQPPPVNKRPPLWPDKKEERIRWIIEEYNNQIDSLDWLESDYVPAAQLVTGTEIFAEAMGCDVHRPDFDMPFALPFVHTAQDAEKVITPSWQETPLALQFEIADAVKSELGEEILLQLPDMQTPMDITALIWEKESFFPALIQEREAVNTLKSKVQKLQTAFIDSWKERYGREFVAHYPAYYMSDGITMSEDEIGTISPAMFEEYCLDDLNFLADRYGGLGIHCCADSRHQWEGFKKIKGLKILNLNRPADQLEEAYQLFKNHVPFLPVQVDFDRHVRVLPRDNKPNTVYFYNTSTREEAIELSQKLKKMREEMISL
jgi:hypothetical protein